MTDANAMQAIRQLAQGQQKLISIFTTLSARADPSQQKTMNSWVSYLTTSGKEFLEQARSAAQQVDTLSPESRAKLVQYQTMLKKLVMQARNAVSKPAKVQNVNSISDFLEALQRAQNALSAEESGIAVQILTPLLNNSTLKSQIMLELASVKSLESQASQIKKIVKAIIRNQEQEKAQKEAQTKKITEEIIEKEKKQEDIAELRTQLDSIAQETEALKESIDAYASLLDKVQEVTKPFIMWETKISAEAKKVIALVDSAMASAQQGQKSISSSGLETAKNNIKDMLKLQERVNSARQELRNVVANAISTPSNNKRMSDEEQALLHVIQKT